MLQSTKNTILENWQGPIERDLPDKSTYHFALKQDQVNLDFYLEKFFDDKNPVFLYFDDFDELVTLCHRHAIDAIIIGGRGDFAHEIDLVHAAKQNVFISMIPIVLYHPEPDTSTVVAAYESGAEEFLHGEWIDRVSKVKIRKVVERNRRDLSINPSTRLPGTSIIEREITRQLEMGNDFAVCYADLDNFKAFNDYYGYSYGDKIVRLTARIIKDIVFDLCREGFVGHIAGDDFIFIVPVDLVHQTCSTIIDVFDKFIPFRYAEEDRRRGYITAADRRGNIEDFPILTISIAVLENERGKFEHMGELSRMLADLKRATKMKEGSNYMVERRAKY